jgi:hypothetical protein
MVALVAVTLVAVALVALVAVALVALVAVALVALVAVALVAVALFALWHWLYSLSIIIKYIILLNLKVAHFFQVATFD